jgi:hypothetical protein
MCGLGSLRMRRQPTSQGTTAPCGGGQNRIDDARAPQFGKIVGEHEKPAGERHPRCLGAASPSPTVPPGRSNCSRILGLTVPRTLLPRRGVID